MTSSGGETDNGGRTDQPRQRVAHFLHKAEPLLQAELVGLSGRDDPRWSQLTDFDQKLLLVAM